MNPRLVIITGLPESKTISLNLQNGDSFTLGRSVECDLPIENIAVSRRHCTITRISDDFRLDDLQSHNGTFINGSKVESQTLKHGDRIDLGNLQTMFLIQESEEDHELNVEIDDGSLITNSTANLYEENAILRRESRIETDMIGESPAMEKVFGLISKVAPTDSNVLIIGESGTEKKLLAQAVHRNSLRREKRFVAINCATLSENLLESELFGHEKGAFTGAVQLKKGKLEIAEGGTLFLDEIGELALPLQAKLLRVLQEREFERVGGLRPIKADIRLIVATNRNLKEEVKKGNFREDLFFQLDVIKIEMPPLRERRSDIPLLARHFVKTHAEKGSRNVTGISDKARIILTAYDWSGNVRQLENAIERAIIFGSTELIAPEDLPDEIIEFSLSAKTKNGSFHERTKAAKQKIIEEELENCNGNLSETAVKLGLNPNNLLRLMKNLGMKTD